MIDENERDLRIVAFLDGEMSDEDCADFERELETDPELAEAVARLSSNDTLLRKAMEVEKPEAIDDAFIAQMGLGEPAQHKTKGQNSEPAPAPSLAPANDNPPFWRRWGIGAGAAIAASLALVLTLTIPSTGSSGIGDALENTPSGQLAALDDGASLTPILTFEAGDGSFCREFTLVAEGASSSGIACRAADGWTVEAWSSDAVEIPDSDEIALAGGDGPSTLDEAYSRLEAGDPVTIDQELRIIQNGWVSE